MLLQMLCHLGPYITHCLSRLWLVGRCRMWRCSPQNIRELLTGPLSFSLFSGPVNQSLGFEEVVVTSCLFLKPSSSSFDGHTPTMVWAVRIGRRRKKNRFHKDNLRHLPRFPDFFVTSSWFSLHSWPVAGRMKEMLERIETWDVIHLMGAPRTRNKLGRSHELEKNQHVTTTPRLLIRN